MEGAMIETLVARVRKNARSNAWTLIAICLALFVRVAVAETFIASGDVLPEVPAGSRVLVYKLASTFEAGDIIVYREGTATLLGRVIAADHDGVQVESGQGKESHAVERTAIVGRVFMNTR
jgi:hypothetical protein